MTDIFGLMPARTANQHATLSRLMSVVARAVAQAANNGHSCAHVQVPSKAVAKALVLHLSRFGYRVSFSPYRQGWRVLINWYN